IASDSAIAKHVGGSEAFRRFVRDELFPVINNRYRTTPERSIVGESLAGLFIVETLLRQPDMFTHYIALDPSTWWDAGALTDSAATLLVRFDAKPRTLFLANSDVKEMADGLRALNRTLQSTPPKNFQWTYIERLDLTHSNIFLGLQVEALIHALR
ncbi:MAG: alpha/beta hydrolase-fold protein, partial [Gemmatimonadaceae bacterium]